MSETYEVCILDFVWMRELENGIMREIEERIQRPVNLEDTHDS